MTDKFDAKKLVWDYIMIMAGVMMLAVSIMVFLEPINLVTGGVSGIGIVVLSLSRDWFGVEIPLWLSNTVLNVPLFAVGLKVRGFAFLRRTVFATAFFSVALFAAGFIPVFEETDILLGAVFGGVISGAGLGLVFRSSATTGGSDLAASIITKYKPHMSISKIMFVIDSLIILAGFFVFGPLKAMYALIAVYISSRVISAVLEGLSFAKAAFVISEKYEEISERIMGELSRGATALHGTGMYTRNEKNVVLCVVSTKEIIALKDIVNEVDKNAFVIVADVREVLGLGFGNV